MLITAVIAVCVLVVSIAGRDVSWALGAAVFLTVLVTSALISAGLFGVIYALGSLPFFSNSVTPPMIPGAEQESPRGRRPLPLGDNAE